MDLLRKLVAALGACGLFLAAGCATPDPDGAAGGHSLSHYTLRLGQPVPHADPLGIATEVFVDSHLKNGDVRTTTGFRGWDYDGDGRFEMVEVLDAGGSVQTRVYDFDGDGLVDLKK